MATRLESCSDVSRSSSLRRQFWRALEPFPVPVRTLDALHLASIEFLREQAQTVELATYDRRLITAAKSLRIPLARL